MIKNELKNKNVAIKSKEKNKIEIVKQNANKTQNKNEKNNQTKIAPKNELNENNENKLIDENELNNKKVMRKNEAISRGELFKKKVAFVSFGCGKNVVELEKIIANLTRAGFKITNNIGEANIVIINTCAFLKSTRKEDFDTISEFREYKNRNLEKIILTGCLASYKLDDISAHLDGVDLILPQSENKNIVSEIAKLYGINLSCNYDPYTRVLTTPSHYAYLRIADGCDSFCSYCTIPYIVGRYHSERMEDLILEAKNLAQNGVKELILVAQDITTYGVDIYHKPQLVALIRELSKIDGIEWIRLIYCYPEHVTDELIQEIKTNDKVCKYIDIPLQHISNEILRKMNRKNTKEKTIELIRKLRHEIPNIQIRTTFILGFPTETDENFDELKNFVRDIKLNQVGFFAYSREKGTIAYNLKPQIPEKIKKERVRALAEIQYNNVLENNAKLVGKTYRAILDEINGNEAIFRGEFQLPDLDGVIRVQLSKNSQNLEIGGFYNVKITGLDGYDLIGEIKN